MAMRARRLTETGPGTAPFHFEYVIHNLNSDRSGRSLRIRFPGATTITAVGFRDVDHHSGEPYATTDWGVTVDGASGTVTWFTDPFSTDPDANALRWATMDALRMLSAFAAAKRSDW